MLSTPACQDRACDSPYCQLNFRPQYAAIGDEDSDEKLTQFIYAATPASTSVENNPQRWPDSLANLFRKGHHICLALNLQATARGDTRCSIPSSNLLPKLFDAVSAKSYGWTL